MDVLLKPMASVIRYHALIHAKLLRDSSMSHVLLIGMTDEIRSFRGDLILAVQHCLHSVAWTGFNRIVIVANGICNHAFQTSFSLLQ